MFHQHFGTAIDAHFHAIAGAGANLRIIFLLHHDFFIAMVKNHSEHVIPDGNRTTESQSVAAMRGLQRGR